MTDHSADLPTRDEGPRVAEIECEVAEVHLATRQVRGLDSREAALLKHHLATCARCREAAETADDDPDAWRWLARVPVGRFEAPQLPVMDPAVYKVQRELASGGMGKVSLATDRRLGREVALKEILDPDLHERFEREALITAHLQHPAIVPIYEAGTWPDGTAFYTMRLVSGTTLQEAIDGAKTVPERLALLHHVVATVEAIAYAHGRRVLHRDLKTTNVLVGELGDTVVIDWGLAKHLDDGGDALPSQPPIPRSGPDLTRVGSVMGTPGFMAPEQALGETIDERADVFALGAILYTLLAGTPPYMDGSRDGDAIMARTVAGPPRALATLAPDAPVDLRAICERAMAHRPANRYPTAREMAAELRRFEAGQLIARPYRLGELALRWLRKHRGVVIAAALALIAVAIIGTISIVNVTRSRTAAEAALVDARAARATAEAGEAAGFEEQARVAFLAGDREPARQLVGEATSRGRDTPTLRYLTAAVARDRDLLTATTPVVGRIVDMVAALGQAPLAIDVHGDVRRGAAILSSLGRDVDGAAFGADGAFVVAYAPPALVRWNVARGEAAWTIDDLAPENADANADIVLAPDERLLAFTNHADGTVAVIDADTGARRGEVRVPGKVTDVAFDPTGALLAVVGDAGEAVVFDAATLAAILRRPAATSEHARVRFLDEHRVVVASGFVTSILDLRTSVEIALVHDTKTYHLDVAPRAGLIVTASHDGQVRLWSATGTLLALHRMPFRPWQVRFDPLGEQLAAATSAELVVWRVPGFVPQLHRYGTYIDMRWDSQGASLASGEAQQERVEAYAAPRANLVRRFAGGGTFLAGTTVVVTGKDSPTVARSLRGDEQGTLPTFPRGLWVPSSTGQTFLFIAEGTSQVALHALPSGKLLGTYPGDQFALSSDGRRAVIIEYTNDTARMQVVDATSGALLGERTFPAVGAPMKPLFLGASHELLIARVAMGWEAWSTDTLSGRALPTDPALVAPEAASSASGTFALYGRYGALVTVHDARGNLIGLAQPRDYEEVAMLSADGHTLAVQNEDGALELFDVGFDLEPRATIRGVARRTFALSNDGTLVYTAHPDGAARVWDARTGRLLDEMHAHWRSINSLQLSPAGETLLVDGSDGYASLWNVTR